MNRTPAGDSRPAQIDGISSERHLIDYLRVLYKRRWVAIPIFVIVFTTAALNSLRATPVYDATARILIENDSPAVSGLDELFRSSDSWYQGEFYETQYRILQSRSLARRTIQDLGLLGHPQFVDFDAHTADVPGTLWSTLTARVRGWIQAVAGPSAVPLAPAPAREVEVSAESQVADALLAGLTIAPVQDSRLVDITFSSADPALAAAVANGVTDAYVDEVVEQRFLVSREAADWLTRQLAEHRLLVEASEAKLQQFREVNGALAVDDGQDIVVRQLTDLNGSVTRARTVRLEREALYNQLSTMGQDELGSFPAVLSNPSVQGLRSELADLERERGQLAERFGDRHPEMIRIEGALRGARDRLDAQVARVVESVRNEYESALANERSLTSALDAQKAEALALNRRSTEYSVLLRETESNRQVYEGLLAQAQEINISSDLRRTNVRVVDAAEVPTLPSSPRIRRDLTMAALGGLLLAISLVLLVEYLDNRIKDPDELFASIGIPVIGMVPRVRDLDDTPLFPRPVPPNLAEAIRSVRTNVLFSSADAGTRIVLVTSPGPGEGKSLIAGSLAWSLGQAEQRVLLIDADMRRPRVHEVVGCDQEPGLSDVLVGQAKMRDVVRKTLVPGLSVIPGGHIPPNPAELLGSERFRSYVQGLGASYDWVVIDSPPVLAVTDASILTNVASGILVVTGADKTTRQSARTAVERLQSFNGRLIGAVLNGVDIAHSPYYYASYYRKDYARYYTRSVEAPEPDVARSEDRATMFGLRK